MIRHCWIWKTLWPQTQDWSQIILTPSCYLVDTYSVYDNNADVVFVFTYCGRKWCIRRISLNWGLPDFPEKDWEDDYTTYRLYNTLDEAKAFVHELKKGERKLKWD